MPDKAIYDSYRRLYVDFQTAIEHHDPGVSSEKIYKDYLRQYEDPTGIAGKTGDLHYPYDVKDIPHIGTGHKLTKQELQDPKWSRGITSQAREDLFNKDVAWKTGEAKRKYNNRGGDFDKLPPSRQKMLADYSFMGITGRGGGESKLSQKIRSGLSDSDIFKEAIDTKNISRGQGRGKLFKDLRNREKGDLAIKKAFLTMEAYLNFSVEEILETNFPGLDSKRQIKDWKNELNAFKTKYESGKFKKKDLDELDKTINYMLMESFGGLTK